MMTTATGEHRVGRRVASHVPGEVGAWVFIFGDMSMFAVLFATFLYYRADKPDVFAEAHATMNQNYGATNTVVLLVSSLLVVLAIRAVRARMAVAPLLVLGAIACGLVFSALKIAEYSEKVGHGITPSTNDFFMFYFVLTGLHWFHLIVGLAVLSALFVLARKPALSKNQLAFFEGGACFWHMVDLLWIVLFPLLYLVR
jgi:nitric oxide reductase NorE protein